MSTPVTFKTATAAADAILRQDRIKLQWAKLLLADLPKDIQLLAIEAINAEIAARAAKDALQSALDDKVNAPSGKRLIVTLGRAVDANTDSILYAWGTASAGSTRIVSFDQFTKG